jgi:hypothetical protein
MVGRRRWGRSEHPAFGLEDSPERRDQDPEDDDDPGVVPIIEPLRFVLDAIKPEDASGWMFPNRIGGALDLDNLAERVIKPRFKANGLKWKGWHAYRRGLATNLHELGVPDIVIKRYSGTRTSERLSGATSRLYRRSSLLPRNGLSLESQVACTALVQQKPPSDLVN